MTINSVLAILSVLMYGVVFGLLLWRIITKQPIHKQQKIEFWIAGLLAVTLHALLLYRGIYAGEGINLGIFKALSLVSWIIALLILITSIKRPVEFLAIILFPAAILCIGLDFFIESSSLSIKQGTPWQLKGHIFITITAFSVLTIAMVQSIILSIQDRKLHNHHPSGIVQLLPPLQVMEHLFFNIVGIGYILLTIGLLIGTTFISDLQKQHLTHKIVLSAIAWALFSISLWGRWHYGWRVRSAMPWVISGFFILLLGFIGTKTVLELILHRN